MNALQSLGSNKQHSVRSASRQGQMIPEDVRRKAETLFDEDFSDVRIILNTSLSRRRVRAFTCGNQIHVASTEYKPDSEQWLELIGHELAHVVQQRTRRARNPYGYGSVVLRDPGLEDEAERMGQMLQRALLPTTQSLIAQLKVQFDDNLGKPRQQSIEALESALNKQGVDAKIFPGMMDVILSLDAGPDAHFTGKDPAKDFMKKVREKLLAVYVERLNELAPGTCRLLKQGDESEASKMDAIKTLALYVGLSPRFELETLESLIVQSLSAEHADKESIGSAVRKSISAASNINGIIHNTQWRDFIQGRTGQMKGLIGELRVLLGIAPLVVGGGKACLGKMLECGFEKKQDVDIFFQAGKNKYCFEVAASVSKLREKAKPGEAQFENYNDIRRGDKNIILAYAIGEPNVWAEVFREKEPVEQIVKGERQLWFDGRLWDFTQLGLARERFKEVTTHLSNAYHANSKPSPADRETVEKALSEGFSSWTPRKFLNSEIEYIKIEAEHMVGMALAPDERQKNFIRNHYRARTCGQAVSAAMEFLLGTNALSSPRRRNQNKRELTPFINLVNSQWNPFKIAIADATSDYLTHCLSWNNDITKARVKFKAVKASIDAAYVFITKFVAGESKNMPESALPEFEKIYEELDAEVERLDSVGY